MKLLLSVFLFLTYFANSCGNDTEPEPEPDKFELVGKYEINFIFEYYLEPNKSPIQASINTISNKNSIEFKADGTCTFQNVNLSIRGISTFGDNSYTGTYKITGRELELNFLIDGKSLKYYASLNSGKEDIEKYNEFKISANKDQRLKAVKANQNSLSAEVYKEQLDYYTVSTRYEQEVEFVKK